MTEESIIDIVSLPWSSNDFVLFLKTENTTSKIISAEPKFSDKPSRPMISLINVEIYKKLLAKRNELSSFKQASKFSKLVYPYERVEKVLKKEYTRQEIINYEILKYINTCMNQKIIKESDTKEQFIFTDEIPLLLDKENEEQYNLKLIFESILKAISNSSNVFVCKIFDIHTNPTYQVIQLLTMFYESVIIIKPRTTNYTTSEKYISCVGFLGSEENLHPLKKVVDLWTDAVKNDLPFCRDFNFVYSSAPEDYTKKINEYNCNNSKVQIKYIEAIFNSVYLLDNQILILESYQNNLANDFCDSFGLKEFKKEQCKNGHRFYNDDPIKLCEECHDLFQV